MRIEELMIGDLVECIYYDEEGKEKSFYANISAIDSDSTLLDGTKAFLVEDSEVEEIDTCLPIPITAEILKKNGFKKELYSDSSFIYGDGVHPIDNVFVAMDFRRDGTARTITIVNFRCSYINNALPNGLYVHELQHKLRDCELFELANNFKV